MTPATVPAHLDFIRRKLQGISPAAAGVKEKRFSTVKSEVAFALRHLGLAGKGTYLTPMVGEWAALWHRLPDKYARTVLSRFFRYGSARNIDPAISPTQSPRSFGRPSSMNHSLRIRASIIKMFAACGIP